MANLTPKQEIFIRPLKFKKDVGSGEKFNNTHCEYDGKKFDSIQEMKRYKYLLMLQNLGRITDLQTQVRFELLSTTHICGQVQRKTVYIADFVYKNTKTGEQVVEDVKGARTDVYLLKRKLMFLVHGIEVVEV